MIKPTQLKSKKRQTIRKIQVVQTHGTHARKIKPMNISNLLEPISIQQV